jgi:hypothetical protein
MENEEIELFLTPLLNLQTSGAFIAAFTSEKRWMTIKKSLFRHWPLLMNFFMAYLSILLRCRRSGRDVRLTAPYCAFGH